MKMQPEWDAVCTRVEKMMRGTAWESDWTYELAASQEHETVLDTYADRYCEAFPIHKALVWPLLAVGVSACCQGAFSAVLPIVGGRLVVADVIQYTGVAGSGYGKSTFLDPHKERVETCLASGAAWRAQQIPARMSAVMKSVSDAQMIPLDDLKRDASWSEVFDGHGRAPVTITESGTSEGLRDALLRGGGAVSVLTAEPDFYRELGAYAKDNGSIRVMLDGWDHAATTVNRAGGLTKHLRGLAMPYGVLVQPTSFDEFTSRRVVAGQKVSDPFVERGVFGRSWLARFEEPPPVPGEAEFWLPGEDSGSMSLTEDLDAAVAQYTSVLDVLVERSNEHRLRNGLYQGWAGAQAAGRGLTIPKPPPASKAAQVMVLGAATVDRESYRQVQLMRLRVMESLKMLAVTDPGSERLLAPMVKRLTQHVVRFAMLLMLCADPWAEKIEGWALRDAGLRIVPWLLTWWFSEMRQRTAQQRVEDLETEIQSNKTGVSLTMEDRIYRGFEACKKRANGRNEHSASDIIREALNTFTSAKRKPLRPLVTSAFEEMVGAQEMIEVAVVDSLGRKQSRFRLPVGQSMTG